jgi:uncharacterized LabA/DUF88 family protein
MTMQRSAIFIDGSNFYFKLKGLGFSNLLHFDFSYFSQYLVGSHILVSQTYYIGKVKTDNSLKSQQLFTNQRKLLQHLQTHNVKYVFGYLLKTNNVFHEKGVDVHLATDLLIGAYENLYDHCILVSSDTDFLPAILQARRKKKIVEYIGFAHQPSRELMKNCSHTRLLTATDLQKFLSEAVP